jgi:hypothetical protein
MPDRHINFLFEEYKALCTSMDGHMRVPYQMLPLCTAVGVVFGIYKAQEPGLAGIIFAYGIVLAFLGVAFIHAILNGTGLRLVEIELLLNRALESRDNRVSKLGTVNGLTWYSRVLGESGRIFPGYQSYVILTTILGVGSLGLSLYGGWFGLTEQLKLSKGASAFFVVLPVVLAGLALRRMWFAEQDTHRKKQELLLKFGVIHHHGVEEDET